MKAPARWASIGAQMPPSTYRQSPRARRVLECIRIPPRSCVPSFPPSSKFEILVRGRAVSQRPDARSHVDRRLTRQRGLVSRAALRFGLHTKLRRPHRNDERNANRHPLQRTWKYRVKEPRDPPMCRRRRRSTRGNERAARRLCITRARGVVSAHWGIPVFEVVMGSGRCCGKPWLEVTRPATVLDVEGRDPAPLARSR